MVKFFTFEEPYYIILIIPLVISSLTTSKNFLLVLNLAILFIFDLIYLERRQAYIDAWFLLFVIFGIILYHLRHRFVEWLNRDKGIEFEGIEKYIYDRDFKILFTEEEFRLFLNIAQMKKAKDKVDLVVEGDKVEKLIYFATIPAYRSVLLKSKTTTISYLHEGAWVGVVEFFLHLTKGDYKSQVDNQKWLVSLSLEIDENEITYYEWDFVSLTNLFKYSNDNRFINKLLLVWIKYLTHSVVRLDDHIANALKAMVHNDKKAKEKTLPLCKLIFLNKL